MKNENKEQIDGFTLIELLVVVLIIGILASVALPQYDFAVKKAKWAPIVGIFRRGMQAEKMYYMANGVYATSFEDLDGFENWTISNNGKTVLSPDKVFYCQLFFNGEAATHLKCWPKGYSEYNFSLAQYFGDRSTWCWNSKVLQAKMCRAWGATNCPIQDSPRGICYITPALE